jgi:hypothetical protein
MGRPAAEEKPAIDAKLLADLSGITPGGEKTSQISSVEFLRNSVKASASPMVPTSTPSSKRSTLSLPGKTSNVYPITSSAGASARCDASSSSLKRTEGVSFRLVAGVPYITWNATGQEYTEHEMFVNTGGACTFCKKTLLDATEVAEFVDKHRVVCTDCLQEPGHDALLEVC